MTYTDRYRHLAEQGAYGRSITARGLSAVLEPYSIRLPLVPRQRTKPAETLRNAAVSG